MKPIVRDLGMARLGLVCIATIFAAAGCYRERIVPFYYLVIDSESAQILEYGPKPKRATTSGEIPKELFVATNDILVFISVKTESDPTPRARVNVQNSRGQPLLFMLDPPFCNVVAVGRDSDDQLVLARPYIYANMSFFWAHPGNLRSALDETQIDRYPSECSDRLTATMSLKVFTHPDQDPTRISVPLKVIQDGTYRMPKIF